MRVPGRVYADGMPSPVDPAEGAVSPGGVGYDINCGVRLVATRVPADEIRPRVHAALARLFHDVPAGVGASAAIPRLSPRELDAVLTQGARWAVARGFAVSAGDVEHCEEGGALAGADPAAVSDRARERGADQLGTLG